MPRQPDKIQTAMAAHAPAHQARARAVHLSLNHHDQRDCARLAGVPYVSFECPDCLASKAKRAPDRVRMTQPPGDAPGQYMTLDLAGPMEIPARGTGARYAVLYACRSTDMKFVFVTERKSDAPSTLKDLDSTIRTLPAKTPIRFGPGTLIYADNEMNTSPWLSTFAELKITFQCSAPYTPENNGYEERQWQTMYNAVRAVLHHFDLDNDLWGYAITHAVYTLNRLPGPDGQSPFERFTGHKPDQEFLMSLPAFGTIAFVKNQTHTTKLQDKARPGIFVGVCPRSHAYKILMDDTKRVNISQSVRFMTETTPANETTEHSAELQNLFPEQNDPLTDPMPTYEGLEDIITADNYQDFNHPPPPPLVPLEEDQDEEQQEVPPSTTPQDTPANETGLRRSTRAYCPTSEGLAHRFGHLAMTTEDSDTTASHWTQTHHVLHAATAVSSKEAYAGPQHDRWMKALRRDMDGKFDSGGFQHVSWAEWTSLKETETLLYPVTSFNRKESAEDGMKARLTANDSANPDHYPAPAPNLDDMRVFLAMSADTGLDMGIQDAKQAFSNGRLRKPVYMRYPRGTRDDGVIRIICALEGLKESNELWYTIVDKHLNSIGFKAIPTNPCIYTRDIPTGTGPLKDTSALIMVHVDDFQITACAKTQLILHQSWPFEVKIVTRNLKESGNPPLLGMGIEYHQRARAISINQRDYITNMHAALGLDPLHQPLQPLKTRAQISPSTPESPKELATKAEAQWYRRAVMSALWVARLTHPVASYPCQHLAGVNHQPTQEAIAAVKDLWGYLYRRRNDTIDYNASNLPEHERNTLIAYVDSDWAADKNDRRSISGHAIFLNGAVVAWRSAKQKSTADSSAAAEMHALAKVLKAIKPLRELLHHMGHQQVKPTVIYEDNQAVIMSLKARFVATKYRHIDVASQNCREGHQDQHAIYSWTPSNQNLSDVLTKNTAAPSLEQNRAKLHGNIHVEHPLLNLL